MIFAKRARPSTEEEPVNFWASYSDMLSAMLLVFILLLVVAMFHYAEFNIRKEKVLKSQESKMVAFKEVQNEIIHNLSENLMELSVKVDQRTGVMNIESGILFAEGDASLSEQGRIKLRKIFEAYIKVILDDRFKDYIRTIEIVGHTNSRGDYLTNLELSQRRALSVMTELLQHAGKDREPLQKMVVASGRSFSQLVLDPWGNEDEARSRRIEMRFRLREEELFEDIYKELKP